MQNNLHQFKASISSVEKTLAELKQNDIGIKGIIINESGRPSILLYNDEKLKKLIKDKSEIIVRVDGNKGPSNFIMFNNCRLVWSNIFN